MLLIQQDQEPALSRRIMLIIPILITLGLFGGIRADGLSIDSYPAIVEAGLSILIEWSGGDPPYNFRVVPNSDSSIEYDSYSGSSTSYNSDFNVPISSYVVLSLEDSSGDLTQTIPLHVVGPIVFNISPDPLVYGATATFHMDGGVPPYSVAIVDANDITGPPLYTWQGSASEFQWTLTGFKATSLVFNISDVDGYSLYSKDLPLEFATSSSSAPRTSSSTTSSRSTSTAKSSMSTTPTQAPIGTSAQVSSLSSSGSSSSSASPTGSANHSSGTSTRFKLGLILGFVLGTIAVFVLLFFCIGDACHDCCGEGDANGRDRQFDDVDMNERGERGGDRNLAAPQQNARPPNPAFPLANPAFPPPNQQQAHHPEQPGPRTAPRQLNDTHVTFWNHPPPSQHAPLEPDGDVQSEPQSNGRSTNPPPSYRLLPNGSVASAHRT